MPKTTGLDGTTRRHGFGIEVQHDIFIALKVCQFNRLTTLIF